jgi:hypothetical protein
MGVDEKAVAKRHRDVTLVNDLGRGTMGYIADDRERSSLDAHDQSLSAKQLAGVEAVAMDMREPFIESTAADVPAGRSKTGRAWATKEALARPLGLSASGLGVASMEALVLLGEPFAPEACVASGADDPKAPGQRVDRLRPSDYQRDERGAQFQDS